MYCSPWLAFGCNLRRAIADWIKSMPAENVPSELHLSHNRITPAGFQVLVESIEACLQDLNPHSGIFMTPCLGDVGLQIPGHARDTTCFFCRYDRYGVALVGFQTDQYGPRSKFSKTGWLDGNRQSSLTRARPVLSVMPGSF